MRVLWLLTELDAPFELAIHAFDASLRDPQFLSCSPAGRVPALEMDGDYYFESGAITEILCERFPQRGLGRPHGDLDRPDWLVWLHFAETVTQHVVALVLHYQVCPSEERSQTLLDRELASLRQCFAAIEGRLSTPVENRDYLLTSGFSAADIALGQAVWMALHYASLEGFPETAAWYSRITSRESFAACEPLPGRGLFQEGVFPIPAAPSTP